MAMTEQFLPKFAFFLTMFWLKEVCVIHCSPSLKMGGGGGGVGESPPILKGEGKSFSKSCNGEGYLPTFQISCRSLLAVVKSFRGGGGGNRTPEDTVGEGHVFLVFDFGLIGL